MYQFKKIDKRFSIKLNYYTDPFYYIFYFYNLHNINRYVEFNVCFIVIVLFFAIFFDISIKF